MRLSVRGLLILRLRPHTFAVKTTDETLTSENWELILNLCDKVQDEGQEGAHNVVAALLKRLTHRNPNVQLYALSLAEALGKNCSIELHRELASRAWTQGLERVITDRVSARTLLGLGGEAAGREGAACDLLWGTVAGMRFRCCLPPPVYPPLLASTLGRDPNWGFVEPNTAAARM